MDPRHKLWNEQQQKLRNHFSNPDEHEQAIEFFLVQHAMVHSGEMAPTGLWSFADEVWKGLSEEDVRRVPTNCDHSIAWITWHMARIEDVTMNMLVAGEPQVLVQDGWLERMKIEKRDTGNGMAGDDVLRLSAQIDIRALKEYRLAVGRRTREIVKQLIPADLKRKVAPSLLEQVRAEGAVAQAAGNLLVYWGRLKICGLLLMPPTRHNFVHLNEGLRVKSKLKAKIRR